MLRRDCFDLAAFIYRHFVRSRFKIEFLYFYWLEPFLSLVLNIRLFFYGYLKHPFAESFFESRYFAILKMKTFAALFKHFYELCMIVFF